MNSTKVTAIVLLLIGTILLIIGLILYGVQHDPSPFPSVSILLGILIMLGACIIMCIGVHTDLQTSLQAIGAAYAPQ